MLSLGSWLLRRWEHCLSLKMEIQKQLDRLGIGLDTLREQWHDQVIAQTKLAPSKSHEMELLNWSY